MEETNISQEQNPLGTAPVGGLIGKFAIPAIISGKDIIGQAQTGTGKTAASARGHGGLGAAGLAARGADEQVSAPAQIYQRRAVDHL